ncbi:glycogen debranching N-terminal domain-containing protein [Streptomyces sp. NPDC088925]|uniref:amylo-alpha-1,6-glucosidase n=1 Tax=Streptomyces sp. NPDC088925 TaxID=3365914 RepID=UPI0038002797
MSTTDTTVLVHEGTFAVLGADGGLTGRRGSSPDGLFRRDARHLSRYELTVDGAAPQVLVPLREEDGGATCVLAPAGTRDTPPAHTVVRDLAVVSGALVERVRLVNNGPGARTARLALLVDADFADQFELRSDHRVYAKDDARRTVRAEADGLRWTYTRGTWESATTLTASPAPAAVEEAGTTARRLLWDLDLPALGSAEVLLRVEARAHGAAEPAPGTDPAAIAARAHADAGARSLPVPPQAPPGLAEACRRGLDDLDRLRVTAHGPAGEELSVPAAGVPWFLTLFGRDSLLTSFFVLPYRPATAAATLRALAALQGTAYDAERGEEPGRIVHEVRHGELAHFRQVPYGRYYGSVDATPLFLALLGAYTETTGDPGPARELERHARAAVDWMHGDGGLDAHGYLVYRPDPDGLVNQNWKDSAGAICFRDGTQAEGPVAVVEAQGYAYDALLRTARLAREHWDDPAYATRLEETATALRARFARDFWLADEDFPALALDGKGRQVDGLASDAGHLLWSGILDEDRARRVGSRLLEPDFFTGWAVRTLAAGQPAHHPLSYHRGSAWPHDNAVIALGLARYGMGEAVRTLTAALAETAAHHGGRLPEVLAGYDRSLHARPVPYPHACSPQAWAAATPLALLTSLRTVEEGTAGTRG